MENELIKKVREKCRIRNTALDSEVSDYIGQQSGIWAFQELRM